jgi:hypothetical protein
LVDRGYEMILTSKKGMLWFSGEPRRRTEDTPRTSSKTFVAIYFSSPDATVLWRAKGYLLARILGEVMQFAGEPERCVTGWYGYALEVSDDG